MPRFTPILLGERQLIIAEMHDDGRRHAAFCVEGLPQLFKVGSVSLEEAGRLFCAALNAAGEPEPTTDQKLAAMIGDDGGHDG